MCTLPPPRLHWPTPFRIILVLEHDNLTHYFKTVREKGRMDTFFEQKKHDPAWPMPRYHNVGGERG